LAQRQDIFNRVQSEDTKRSFWIGRVRRTAAPVLPSVFDPPLKGKAGEDENAPIMLARIVKAILPRHDRKRTATQLRIELKNTERHLNPSAAKRRAEPIIEFDDFLAPVHGASLNE
jgi:hypothetical protein